MRSDYSTAFHVRTLLLHHLANPAVCHPLCSIEPARVYNRHRLNCKGINRSTACSKLRQADIAVREHSRITRPHPFKCVVPSLILTISLI